MIYVLRRSGILFNRISEHQMSIKWYIWQIIRELSNLKQKNLKQKNEIQIVMINNFAKNHWKQFKAHFKEQNF